MSLNTNDSTSNGLPSSAPTSSVGPHHSVANLTDTSNEIEILSPARLAFDRAAFRHQTRVNPAHSNMDYRANQAQAIENARRAIEDARSVRRSSFIQAAAAGRQALRPHHDPQLGHRGERERVVPGLHTNALAQHHRVPPMYNPQCDMLQVGEGVLTNEGGKLKDQKKSENNAGNKTRTEMTHQTERQNKNMVMLRVEVRERWWGYETNEL